MTSKNKRYPQVCSQCARGWVPGTEKTFDPCCPGCQKKLAIGLRTGDESRRADHSKMSQIDWARLQDKRRAQYAARRAQLLAMPAPREKRG